MNIKTEQFYNALKLKLEETSDWPSDYLFKFIIPSDQKKIDTISNIFNHSGAIIKTKPSSKGNYTSISVRIHLESPDAVIEKYITVGEQIEDVISL